MNSNHSMVLNQVYEWSETVGTKGLFNKHFCIVIQIRWKIQLTYISNYGNKIATRGS